jgi:hypothetical protein
MATASRPGVERDIDSDSWYSVPAEVVTARLQIDPLAKAS